MSLWRYSVFMYNGLREYGKAGYAKAAKTFTPNALDVDLSARALVITGANQGLGKVVALEFARRGGTVHLLCRNAARAQEAQRDIVEQTRNANVHVHVVDMGRPQQIRAFVSDFKARGHQVHVLVNNAGCMINDRQLTPEGLEANFATNTFGVYLLTTLLLDELAKSQQSRVINVSSAGMLLQRLNVNDLQSTAAPFVGDQVYAQQKRQMVEMTDRWAELHAPRISFYSVHPGWADTETLRTSMPGFHSFWRSSLRTVEQGADAMVYLAVAADVEQRVPSGSFVQDRVPVAKHIPLASTQATRAEVDQLFAQLAQMDAAIAETGHM